jgi:FkbM family methyltransferase
MVRAAYERPDSRYRASIQRWARRWYGLEPSRFPMIWLMAIDQVRAAQARLYHAGFRRPLGVVAIGANDVLTHATTTDAHASSIYLWGFDDNLTVYETYARYARPGSVVVDVGANCALHTAVLARCVGPEGRVHAFEPVPQLAERIEETLALNRLSNVVVHNVGVAERSGSIAFLFDPLAFNVGLGHHANGGESSSTIEVVSLDEALPSLDGRVSLVKIDVEGMEVRVLRGAQRLLTEHRPVVIVEVNSEAWSLDELRDAFPFDVDVRAVPPTKSRAAGPVDRWTPSGTNLVVEPR